MSPIALETRLEGRHASIDGLAAYVHRQLDHGPFQRVEVKLSNHGPSRLDRAAVQQRIVTLLREHGHPQAGVSVRGFDNLLDDALGAHQIRLIAAPRQDQPDPRFAGTVSSRGLPGAWQSLLQRLQGIKPDNATKPGMARAVKAITPQVPAIGQREAVQAFERALGLAMAAHDEAEPIGQTEVTVRLPALHQTLSRLLADDAAGASQHVRERLAEAGVAARDGMRLVYRFTPRDDRESTVYLADSDVEVTLRAVLTATGDATLMPIGQAAFQGVAVRVVGSTDRDFDQPVELGCHALPLRIDRQWLIDQGFGKAHAPLLAGVSQSSPLQVLKATAHGIHIDAGERKLPDGGKMPLYHRLSDRLPLSGLTQLQGPHARLSLNHLDGLGQSGSTRVVPALIIEIQALPI